MGEKIQGKDISNKVVLILLIIVMIVSVFSLGIYMNTLERISNRQTINENNLNVEPSLLSPNAQGIVSLEIQNRPE